MSLPPPFTAFHSATLVWELGTTRCARELPRVTAGLNILFCNCVISPSSYTLDPEKVPILGY